MRRKVHACAVPTGSAIASLLPGAHFCDAWTVDIDDPTLSALDHLMATLSATPRWVEAMLGLRNRIVSRLGLKNLGELSGQRRSRPLQRIEPGDRVGIFTLINNTPDEVLVGDADHHLRVVLSVLRQNAQDQTLARLVLSTGVHVHNLLGHLYMLPVAPMHKLIAPAVLARTST